MWEINITIMHVRTMEQAAGEPLSPPEYLSSH